MCKPSKPVFELASEEAEEDNDDLAGANDLLTKWAPAGINLAPANNKPTFVLSDPSDLMTPPVNPSASKHSCSIRSKESQEPDDQN
jgi:hypothetical protein